MNPIDATALEGLLAEKTALRAVAGSRYQLLSGDSGLQKRIGDRLRLLEHVEDTMRAHERGEPVDCRAEGSSTWIPTDQPAWQYDSFEYRAHPAPRRYYIVLRHVADTGPKDEPCGACVGSVYATATAAQRAASGSPQPAVVEVIEVRP